MAKKDKTVGEKVGKGGAFQKRTLLRGMEKVGLLFATLGPVNTKDMIKYFTTRELHKIRVALKTVKGYDLNKEVLVLAELVRYGKNKQLVEVDSSLLDKEEYAALHTQRMNKVREQKERMEEYGKNAKTVANAIGVWLKDE